MLKSDLSGIRFGRWTVVEFSHTEGRNGSFWRVLCDCGISKTISRHSLIRGNSTSCGCRSREAARNLCIKRNTTHGKSKDRIYRVWQDMMRRCYKPNTISYKWYGARGIKVQDSWHKFENFLADFPEIPKGLSLDRIDSNGHYEKGNVKLSTDKEQCNNKRTNKILILDGKRYTMKQAAEEFSVSYSAIRGRKKRGLSDEEAVYGRNNSTKNI